jgi:hypothetical protein
MPTFTALFLATLLAAGPAVRPPVTIEATAREVVANFAAGKFKAVTKDFNDELAPQVTPAVVDQLRQQVEAAAGPFRAITSVRHFRHEGQRVVELTCAYARSLVAFRIVFDNYDRISQVYVDPVETPKVDPALEAVARKFVANFTAGRFDFATMSFDKTLRAQLTATKLGELAKTVTTRFGAYRSISEVSQTVDETYRTIAVKTVYENAPVEFLVAFNTAGLISGVRVGPLTAAR